MCWEAISSIPRLPDLRAIDLAGGLPDGRLNGNADAYAAISEAVQRTRRAFPAPARPFRLSVRYVRHNGRTDCDWCDGDPLLCDGMECQK